MNLLHVGLATGRQRTKVRFMLQRHHYGMEFIDGYDFQLSVNLSTFALHSLGWLGLDLITVDLLFGISILV